MRRNIMFKVMKKFTQSEYFIYILSGMICAIVFCLIYGVHVLNPTYTDWLLAGGDLSQHYLGWMAYRNNEWHFPLGMIDNLAYPNFTSLIFTDSIPIFALIFKILSPILPSDFQYFGLWGIMCFALQGVLSVRILKNFTDNKAALVISSIIFAYTPVVIFRMYAHTALAGQWIILLGLEPIFAYEKYKDNKKIYFIAALVALFSSSTHIYFVFMSGIVLLGICLLDILSCERVKRSILILIVYIFTAATVIGLFGGFGSGMQAEAGGLGKYSMNLNAFFNPQGYSCIFQALPLYGDGQYEGFAYLGAGWILICIVALVNLIGSDKGKAYFVNHWRKISVLFLISLVALVVALSPIVTIGDKVLYELKLPELIINTWSVFRSSGRVVWIIIYIIMLCGCIILYKLLNKRTGVVAVIFALFLQVYDIHEVLIKTYNNYGQVREYESLLKTENFWEKVASDSKIKHIVYYSYVEKNVMYSFTKWALENEKTLNNFYFARTVDDLVSESREEALTNLSEEDIFIFNFSDQLNCVKYDLNYYNIDGFIIGYVNEVEGYTPMKKTDFARSWNFGDNKYIDATSGIDTENGRELYSNGLSYGPYWSIPRGKYKLKILGEEIQDNLEIGICSQQGQIYYDYSVESQSESEIVISFSLNEDVADLEIIVRNNSEDNILLKGIEVRCAE